MVHGLVPSVFIKGGATLLHIQLNDTLRGSARLNSIIIHSRAAAVFFSIALRKSILLSSKKEVTTCASVTTYSQRCRIEIIYSKISMQVRFLHKNWKDSSTFWKTERLGKRKHSRSELCNPLGTRLIHFGCIQGFSDFPRDIELSERWFTFPSPCNQNHWIKWW